MRFGLNEVLAIFILIISICLIRSEIKNKDGKELLINSSIVLVLIGVSVYNLITESFSVETIISTVAYLLNIVASLIYATIFILHYFKNRNK